VFFIKAMLVDENKNLVERSENVGKVVLTL